MDDILIRHKIISKWNSYPVKKEIKVYYRVGLGGDPND